MNYFGLRKTESQLRSNSSLPVWNYCCWYSVHYSLRLLLLQPVLQLMRWHYSDSPFCWGDYFIFRAQSDQSFLHSKLFVSLDNVLCEWLSSVFCVFWDALRNLPQSPIFYLTHLFFFQGLIFFYRVPYPAIGYFSFRIGYGEGRSFRQEVAIYGFVILSSPLTQPPAGSIKCCDSSSIGDLLRTHFLSFDLS